MLIYYMGIIKSSNKVGKMINWWWAIITFGLGILYCHAHHRALINKYHNNEPCKSCKIKKMG